ncbi:hypothetical protein GMMP15_1760003 [Candidatus Magnetomoraceae bacterium gMMP-15]
MLLFFACFKIPLNPLLKKGSGGILQLKKNIIRPCIEIMLICQQKMLLYIISIGIIHISEA